MSYGWGLFFAGKGIGYCQLSPLVKGTEITKPIKSQLVIIIICIMTFISIDNELGGNVYAVLAEL
jgi:hypothetical protein